MEQPLWTDPDGAVGVVEVRISGTRTRQQCARREVDARLWDNLDESQQAAFQRIHDGFVLLSAGLMQRAQMYERVDKSTRDDCPEVLLIDYKRWADQTKREGHNVTMALDVIGHGMRIREVARQQNKSRRFVLSNLLSSLDVFCSLAGWKPKAA